VHTAFGWGTFRKGTTVNTRHHRCEETIQLTARHMIGGWGVGGWVGKDWIEWLRIGTGGRIL